MLHFCLQKQQHKGSIRGKEQIFEFIAFITHVDF